MMIDDVMLVNIILQVFAIQNGGACRGGKEGHLNYNNLCLSSNCSDGKGGSWSSDVYEILDHNGLW